MLTGSPAATTDLSLLEYRRFLRRWSKKNRDQNLVMIAWLRELADGLGIAPGQLALAWVLAQGDDVVPIPGTKRRRWLEQNVAAADVRLPAHVMEELDHLHASGDRYGPTTARTVDTSNQL